MSEEGLSGWEYKSNEEKAKDVEDAFKEDFVVEVEEEKMEEKEVKRKK